MITVQIRTPKVKLSKHRIQNSQPTILNYSNLNSFHEFFNNNSHSNEKRQSIFNSRCKTENTQMEVSIKPNKQKQSSQSTTISLASSASPNQGMKNVKGNSNSSFKIIQQSNHLNPFKENATNQKLQQQLQKVVERTKFMMNNYQVVSKKWEQKEQELKEEITTLKKIIDKQNAQLEKHNLNPIYF
ncbi:unnamed protein product [Paramecium primaurelia]|uniref:Uncharacterized protein n=1 Tax=Paramecium primaurelia TaxID=5886 RepID=A0A8S1MGV8_PARPR|nr:unnamed protein product [Paramecium primaurelia]